MFNRAERIRMIREEWSQDVLPQPPKVEGWHFCWLSTTNSTDPIYKRIQRGYMPVKSAEVPAFGSQFMVNGGEFDGCISCNEMLLFKIPTEVFEDLMTIYHHDMPIEQEESIRESVEKAQQFDSNDRKLMEVEGDFNSLGRGNARSPSFIS